MLRFKVRFVNKKTGFEDTVFLEAMSLHGAMRKIKSKHAIRDLHSIIQCDDC
jgi:hypothetical protein